MKKQVQEYIRSLGGSSSYAGNTVRSYYDKSGEAVKKGSVTTLFINDPSGTIASDVKRQFENLPFTLKTN